VLGRTNTATTAECNENVQQTMRVCRKLSVVQIIVLGGCQWWSSCVRLREARPVKNRPTRSIQAIISTLADEASIRANHRPRYCVHVWLRPLEILAALLTEKLASSLCNNDWKRGGVSELLPSDIRTINCGTNIPESHSDVYDVSVPRLKPL
jgi:hypothetical protein